ncbi:MAG: hypothetical protein GXP08_02160 [Gammaproteobacteria bacterium]|nr:hypothetical protein [Gammaproteobacteria bacterium]
MQNSDFWAVIGGDTYKIKNDGGLLVYEDASAQPPLYIRENDHIRWLHFGSNAVQSAVLLGRDRHQLVLPCTIFLQSFLLFKESITSALIVGSGGGSVARFLRYHFNAAAIHAVELNHLVAQQAKAFFYLSDSVCQVSIADACTATLAEFTTAADVVIVDLFDANAIPSCLYSSDFYLQCAEVLGDAGILVANVVVDDEKAFTSILAKVRHQFQQRTLCVPVPDHKNIIILAFKQKPRHLNRVALDDIAVRLSPYFDLDLALIIDEIFKVNPKKDGVLIM